MYECMTCAHIGRRGQLVEHVIRCHVSTDRAPWSCSLCGYCAISRKALGNHESLYLHRKAMKDNPGTPSEYVKSSNPYIVREEIDIIMINKSGMTDSDSSNTVDDWSGKKRKGLDSNPITKKMRREHKRSETRDFRYRQSRCNTRERPDMPEYDMDDDNRGKRFDNYCNRSYPDYDHSSYPEKTNRQSRFNQNNRSRNQSNTRWNMGTDEGTYDVEMDIYTEENDQTILLREDHNSKLCTISNDTYVQTAESDGQPHISLLDSHEHQRKMESNIAEALRRAGAELEWRSAATDATGTTSDALSMNVKTHETELLDGCRKSFDLRQKIEHRTSSTEARIRSLSGGQLQIEDFQFVNSGIKMAPVSSSTVVRPPDETFSTFLNQAMLQDAFSQEVPTTSLCLVERTGHHGNRRHDSGADQSAEIGSTCTSRDKYVSEVCPEFDDNPSVVPSRQICERRRSEAETNGALEQKHPPVPEPCGKLSGEQQTVLEEHGEEEEEEEEEEEGGEEEEDDHADSQLLEEKMTELIAALEPLKNISKALIALDHHMRRLLPMVEGLTKDATSAKVKKK